RFSVLHHRPACDRYRRPGAAVRAGGSPDGCQGGGIASGAVAAQFLTACPILYFQPEPLISIPRLSNSCRKARAGIAISGGCTPWARISPRAIICAATERGKPVSRATALKTGRVL